MAMNNGNNDFVVLSNGSILSGATSPSILSATDEGIAAQHLPSKEAPRAKVSLNGCLQLNGTIKPSFLPLDNQRTQQMLTQCCHPCPYHHPLSSHNKQQECHSLAGSTAPSPMTSCCLQPHTEYSTSICQNIHLCIRPPAAFNTPHHSAFIINGLTIFNISLFNNM